MWRVLWKLWVNLSKTTTLPYVKELWMSWDGVCVYFEIALLKCVQISIKKFTLLLRTVWKQQRVLTVFTVPYLSLVQHNNQKLLKQSLWKQMRKKSFCSLSFDCLILTNLNLFQVNFSLKIVSFWKIDSMRSVDTFSAFVITDIFSFDVQWLLSFPNSPNSMFNGSVNNISPLSRIIYSTPSILTKHVVLHILLWERWLWSGFLFMIPHWFHSSLSLRLFMTQLRRKIVVIFYSCTLTLEYHIRLWKNEFGHNFLQSWNWLLQHFQCDQDGISFVLNSFNVSVY